MQKTIRFGLFLFLVTGLLLTACEPKPIPTDDSTPSTSSGSETTNPVTTPPTESTPPATTPETTSVYKDGSYSATGSYVSPAGPESIGVTVVIKDDMVTSVSVTPTATDATSKLYQQSFTKNISALVVGKSLNEIGPFSAVSGSSLTPKAFNSALASIKAEAAL